MIHNMVENEERLELELSHSIVIPDRERQSFYLSTKLFNFMVSAFVETQSISAVFHLCSELWVACGIHNEKFLSRPVLTSLLLPYLFETSHYVTLTSQINAMNSSSSSLSCDHTYKYVKHFSVTDPNNKKKRVCTIVIAQVILCSCE